MTTSWQRPMPRLSHYPSTPCRLATFNTGFCQPVSSADIPQGHSRQRRLGGHALGAVECHEETSAKCHRVPARPPGLPLCLHSPLTYLRSCHSPHFLLNSLQARTPLTSIYKNTRPCKPPTHPVSSLTLEDRRHVSFSPRQRSYG